MEFFIDLCMFPLWDISVKNFLGNLYHTLSISASEVNWFWLVADMLEQERVTGVDVAEGIARSREDQRTVK